jgi:transcriptional regulator with XRE-family HTH domain
MPPKDEGNTLKRFGINVRARRAALDFSQEALAEKADLDRTYIGGIERGERNLTLLSARRVAKALKSTVSELCEGIDR